MDKPMQHDDARFATTSSPVIATRKQPTRPTPPENDRVREDHYPGTGLPWWEHVVTLLASIVAVVVMWLYS